MNRSNMARPAPDAPADIDSAQVFERAAEVFGLLATPLRLRILSLLCCSEMNVDDLRAALGSAQPRMSQNLATLYRCGVLTRQRRGAHLFYGIHPLKGAWLCDAVRRMVGSGVGPSAGFSRSAKG